MAERYTVAVDVEGSKPFRLPKVIRVPEVAGSPPAGMLRENPSGSPKKTSEFSKNSEVFIVRYCPLAYQIEPGES